MGASPTQRSVADVLQDIVSNLQQIIRSEFRLAKVELSDKASKAAKPVTGLAIGGVVAFYGVGFLLLAAVYALAMAVALWLAALIVGAVLAIIGAILISASRSALKQIDPVPEKTVQTVKETVQTVKETVKGNVQNVKENVQWAKGQTK
ncbi:MAG: phage holin family protein [Candidatus Acidiferrum sp.]